MEKAGNENQTPITTRHDKGNSMMPWSGYPVVVGCLPVVTGISDQTAAVYPGYVRLYTGLDRAIKARVGGSPGYLNSWSYLPIPSGGAWLSAKNRALCISPNGTYIGGYATRTQSSPAVQEQMGVFWSGATMTSLFAEVALNVARVGEARAVNNSGEFVGSRTLANSVGFFIPKAYRSRSGGTEVLGTDFLIPPFQEGVRAADVPSQALAISERSGSLSGIAAGWAGRRDGDEWLQRPAVWWSRTNGLPEPTNADWLKLAFAGEETTGQANAINASGVLYGWIRASASSERRAARWINAWTPNTFVDDKFEVYGFSEQWQLEEFVDANDNDAILGNGLKNGSARGFLLVPQPNVN